MSGTKRISALTELASGSVDEDDIIAIVDMSQASVTDKTKHVKVKNLIAVGGRLEIDSFAELATKFVGSSPSSTQQIAATNDIVVWREKGFRYQCVTSGEHFDYTGSGGLKWKALPVNGWIYAEAFGIAKDGVTDDASKLIAAAAAAAAGGFGLAAQPDGTIYIESAVDLRGISKINIACDILVDTAIAGVPVQVGGFASSGNSDWTFKNVTDGTSVASASPPARPILRIVGAKTGRFYVVSCNYLQLYADVGAGAAYGSTAYIRVDLGGIISKLEMTDNGGFSWVNENKIYGGRIIRLYITPNGYAHNHNKFFENVFEGSSVDIQIGGSQNGVYGARFESVSGSSGVTFLSDSYSNTVEWTWSGSGNPRADYVRTIPVTDNGMGNKVYPRVAAQVEQIPIFEVGANSGVLATATTSNSVDPRVCPHNPGFDNLTAKLVATPSLAGLYVGSASRYIALSELIPVELGDVIIWDADYTGSLMRTSVFVYDSDMEPILSEGAGGAYVSMLSGSFSTSYGRYVQGSDISADSLRQAPVAVIRSEVAFVRVGIFVGTTGLIRNFSAYLAVPSLERGKSKSWARPRERLLTLDGTPTKGYAPLNTLVWETGTPGFKRCTFQYETRLNGALATGATSATVTTISTVANGDIVGILLDNGETHWTTVSSLSGSTFTIAAIPASRSAPDGARIVFNRWA